MLLILLQVVEIDGRLVALVAFLLASSRGGGSEWLYGALQRLACVPAITCAKLGYRFSLVVR